MNDEKSRGHIFIDARNDKYIISGWLDLRPDHQRQVEESGQTYEELFRVDRELQHNFSQKQ